MAIYAAGIMVSFSTSNSFGTASIRLHRVHQCCGKLFVYFIHAVCDELAPGFPRCKSALEVVDNGRIFSMMSFAPIAYIFAFSFSVRLRGSYQTVPI